jgi:hypothetical protein
MLFLVVFLAILFVVGIALLQKPHTKKIGIFIIISIAIIALIRYKSIGNDKLNSETYNNNIEVVQDFNYLDGENIVMILLFTSVAALAASPFLFLIGLFLAIKGVKHRKMGLMFMIGSIIAFIVGSSISSTLCGSGNI